MACFLFDEKRGGNYTFVVKTTSPCVYFKPPVQYVIHTHSDDLNTDDDDAGDQGGQVPHTGRFPLAKAEFVSKSVGVVDILLTHHPVRF